MTKINQDGATNPRSLWLIAILLAVVIGLIHSRTLLSPPLFDDKLQLTTDNIFTAYAVPFGKLQRWLSYGSFAWTYKLAGENWVIFRAQNVLLHSLVVASLFLFLNRLFNTVQVRVIASGSHQHTHVLAAAGALLYGLHPATVYAVSYLIQRSIIMATLFSVLSLWCLLEATQKKKISWYIGAAALYLLALSSKEHAIMLPAVGVAMVYLVRARVEGIGARWMWGGAAIGIAAIAIVISRIYGGLIGGVFDETSRKMIADISHNYPVVAQYPYLLSVLNESYLFFKYLFLWLFPIPTWMAVDMREPFPLGFGAWPQIMGPALLVSYGVLAVWLIRKPNELGLLGFALLVPLLMFPTELATVWIQDPFVIYRSYLWMIMLPAALPATVSRLTNKAALGAFAVIVLAFGMATWNRLGTFTSQWALWDDAVKYNASKDAPGSLGRERGYNERGLAFAQQGELDKALADYTEAIRINPKDANLYSNRGGISLLANDIDRAQADINVALSLEPNNSRALTNQAAIQQKRGDLQQAYSIYSRIISEVGGATKDTYSSRGVILLKSGKAVESIGDFDNAINTDPNFVDAYINRGTAKGLLGRKEEALADFTQAIRLYPKSIDAHINRALVLISLARQQDALRDAEDAVSIDPTHIKAHLVRAQIYMAAGRIQEGMKDYDIVLNINPKEAMAYLNRGEVFLFLKNHIAAKRDLTQACQLGLQPACEKLAMLGK